MCNEYIRRDDPVLSADSELESARQIDTLRAVFGETYPNPVRVSQHRLKTAITYL